MLKAVNKTNLISREHNKTTCTSVYKISWKPEKTYPRTFSTWAIITLVYLRKFAEFAALSHRYVSQPHLAPKQVISMQ